jgi:predicted amidohydrolase YtcJ
MRQLLYNATFYTMLQENDFYDSMLIEDGIIKQLFSGKPDIAGVEEIDLKGAFVYPGFIDTHTHSFEGGLYNLGANLNSVNSLTELFDKLAGTVPVSGKIFAYGFDENNISEKRFPTALELDQIFPDIPAILRRVDGHSCVVNSKAADQIDWEKPMPGSFTGHLYSYWNGRASNWFHRNLDEESILKAYVTAAQIAVKSGHTTVHTMIGDSYSDPKHYNLIYNNLSKFPVNFILYPQITDIKVAKDLGAARIGGCILADGSFGSRTAALMKPYTDRSDSSGTLYRTDDFWEKFILEAHKEDLQLAVHCIGDRAIDQILKCYEKAQQTDPKDLRHEIIHNELTTDEMLDRIKYANVSAVMQPLFDRLWGNPGGLYETVLGKERTSRTTRLASIYQREILLTGGSDWYITEIDALKGIDASVRIHNSTERLTPYQAVKIYTSNAAALNFDEEKYGTLSPGLQADITILAEDIFHSEDIQNVEIVNVMRDGRWLL